MIDSLHEYEPLAPYTSFKVGGAARYFLAPKTETEMISAIIWASDNNIPLYIFGKGSNLVFSDSGFKGLVIHTGDFTKIDWNEYEVTCSAGILMYTVMKQSVQRGFSGIHKLGGIPGTLGGCTYINAGAYGQETSDVVVEVVSCTEWGELKIRPAAKCRFQYRHSLFCELQETILSVKLKLTPAQNKSLLEDEMRESLAHRKKTQPLSLPNSGSIFKRPAGMFPGKIIEEAGLKGQHIGDAEVSPKHANFIVNKKAAKAQEIYDLSMQVIDRVKSSSGISLEHEVRFVGECLPWPS